MAEYFSFETLVLYKDLENLEEAAAEHPIVRAFAGASVSTSSTEGSERLGDDLDEAPTPAVVPIPALPADSSQLAALTWAHAGDHVVVYGPPGTGKSQTIANLVADALGESKTVLFVSAKMAALEVVHDRLQQQGFGRFCLEAHSTRSGKAHVIDELRATLKLAESANGSAHPAQTERYIALREQLNQVVRELHRTRTPLGRSVYEALGTFAHLQDVPNVQAALPWDATTADVEQLQEALDCLGGLQAAADVFANRATHAWRGCRVADASYATRERLLAALEEVRDSATAILGVANLLEVFIGPLLGRSFEDLDRCAGVFDAIAQADWLPAGWTAMPPAQLAAAATLLRTASSQRQELDDARTTFATGVQEPGIEPDAALGILTEGKKHYGSWLSRLSFGYRGWKKRVREVVRPTTLDYQALVELADLAQRDHDAQAWFSNHPDVLSLLTNVSQEIPERVALDTAAGAYPSAATVRAERERLGIGAQEGEPRAVSSATHQAARAVSARLQTARPELNAALTVLQDGFGDDFLTSDGFLASETAASATLGSVVARASEALLAPQALAEWVTFYRASQQCHAVGLTPFLKALEKHGAERAVDSFRRRFWMSWADTLITRESCLNQFNGLTREELIGEFARADTAIRRAATLAAIDGAARGAVRVNTAAFADKSSQLGILRHELQKKRPRPLRKLFAEIPQVLQAIKPCMLMSPISVSTYLALGQFHFDLVVFDEASQIPPAEAIPSILRADQVIVAGDDKQLPPSSFFSSSLFADEAAEEEERVEVEVQSPAAPEPYEPLESLLNDCEATIPLFQPAHLKWHYRSRDERLIAFSNHTFYGGDLITFPSPGEPADRGVQLHYLPDGVWDRGKSRTNRPEARKVAELVLRHLDEHPTRSLGVVALNVAQKEAIEDALEETLALRSDLRERLYHEGVAEPFFVKALENVQGDERDSIFISTGYGRDATGAMSLNFGPINQEGGWRRLNVLVTRAKFLIVLVTSLRSEQLRAVAPGNRGAVAFRDFIQYAERGGHLAPESPRLTNAETNEFDAIAAALRDRGLEVDEQVGASSFRIDLAVRDPRDKSWYLLTIECDGATYHSSRSARDRDVLRADMLRDMGWKIHRIWSVDWFRDPEGMIDATMKAVERAMNLGGVATGVPAPPDQSHPSPSPPTRSSELDGSDAPRAEGAEFPAGVRYRYAPIDRNDRDMLLDPDYTLQLASEIQRIVRHEEPVHEDLVLRRACKLNGVASAKSNVRSNFARALGSAIQSGSIRRDEDGFLRASADPMKVFRVPADELDDVRDIEHIPLDELRIAILHVVESQFGLERKALIPQTAYVIGYGKTSVAMSDRIGSVVDNLIERGELRLSGFQITLS